MSLSLPPITADADADVDPDAEMTGALGNTATRRSLVTAAGAIALGPVATVTTLSVLRNAPVVLPAPVRSAAPGVEALAAVVPALALLALGVTADRRAERVALLVAGVFPLLATLDDAAWLPAAGGLLAGGSAAVALTARQRDAPTLLAVAALALAGLAASVLAAAGVVPVGVRDAGAIAAFGALAALPLARSLDTPGLAVWVLVAMAVTWAAASAPYVAGAVTLVAFGAGGMPIIVLALGVGGAVAVALASARERRWGPAVAALLLLAAGAPATIPRATAVVLALVVLAATWDPGPADANAPSRGGEGRGA